MFFFSVKWKVVTLKTLFKMSPVPDGNDMPENNHPEEGTIQDEPLPHHMIGQIPSDSEEEEEGEEFTYDGQEYVYAPLPQDPDGFTHLEEGNSSDSSEDASGTHAEGVRLEMGDGQGPSSLTPATQASHSYLSLLQKFPQ